MSDISVCASNLEAMLKRDARLIHMVANKYRIDGFSHEDLFQEGCIKYMKVVRRNTYNPAKGMFSTYIVNCLNSCFKSLHRRYMVYKKSIKCDTNIPLPTVSEHSENRRTMALYGGKDADMEEDIYNEQVFKMIEDTFDPLTALIFIDRIKGYSIQETKIRYEEMTGTAISRCRMSMILKRNKDILAKMLKNKGAI